MKKPYRFCFDKRPLILSKFLNFHVKVAYITDHVERRKRDYFCKPGLA